MFELESILDFILTVKIVFFISKMYRFKGQGRQNSRAVWRIIITEGCEEVITTLTVVADILTNPNNFVL